MQKLIAYKILKGIDNALDNNFDILIQIKHVTMTLGTHIHLKISDRLGKKLNKIHCLNNLRSPSLGWIFQNRKMVFNHLNSRNFSTKHKLISWQETEIEMLHLEVIKYAKKITSKQTKNIVMHGLYRLIESQNISKSVDFFHDKDWEKIAKDASLWGRSGADCRVMWYSTSFGVNYEKWSRNELVCLVQISNKYKGMRWDLVAKELGKSRRPISCLQVWQRSLNPILLSSKWNFEEDKKLLMAVKKIGNYNWVELSKLVSSARTPKQCFDRYSKLRHYLKAFRGIKTDKYLLKNNIPKKSNKIDCNNIDQLSRWTKEEELDLIVAVTFVSQTYGKLIWSKVAKFSRTHNAIQCRQRWLKYMNPSLNYIPWTRDEEICLLSLVNIRV
jgi:hypothetical protein